jgi:hypothetical protein
LAAHFGKKTWLAANSAKNIIDSTFWENNMIGSTFWEKNMVGSTFWQK